MARPMTAAEKQTYHQYYPVLDVDAAVVTGENDFVYNCLSWTLGYTDRWTWPGANEADFDALYGAAGFSRSASHGVIAAWGHSASEMTHGSISGQGHGPRWESKCGSLLRFQHGHSELDSGLGVGAEYGQVRYYYKRTWRWWWRRLLEALRLWPRRPWPPDPPWEVPDVEIPRELRDRFETLYARWREDWSSPQAAIRSDPAAVKASPVFEELKALGSEILPLIVEKLARPEEFLALQLYDELSPMPKDGRSGEEMLQGEQARARRVVERWRHRRQRL